MDKWILAREKRPDKYKEVLCCLENGTMRVLYFDGGNWCHPTGEPYISINYENGIPRWHNKVVAWMVLPDPYTEAVADDS